MPKVRPSQASQSATPNATAHKDPVPSRAEVHADHYGAEAGGGVALPLEIPALMPFYSFAAGRELSHALVDDYLQLNGLDRLLEKAPFLKADDHKKQKLIDALRTKASELKQAQDPAERAELLEHIVQSLSVLKLATNKAQSARMLEISQLRRAQRLTADDAKDQIQALNEVFASSGDDALLKGERFELADDQKSIEQKMNGKGIGPFYINDKGDKLLAADRDAHGGGQFKYFTKFKNRWVRQGTLDGTGKLLRS